MTNMPVSMTAEQMAEELRRLSPHRREPKLVWKFRQSSDQSGEFYTTEARIETIDGEIVVDLAHLGAQGEWNSEDFELFVWLYNHVPEILAQAARIEELEKQVRVEVARKSELLLAREPVIADVVYEGEKLLDRLKDAEAKLAALAEPVCATCGLPDSAPVHETCDHVRQSCADIGCPGYHPFALAEPVFEQDVRDCIIRLSSASPQERNDAVVMEIMREAASLLRRLSSSLARARGVIGIMTRLDHSTEEKVKIAREALTQPEKANDAE